MSLHLQIKLGLARLLRFPLAKTCSPDFWPLFEEAEQPESRLLGLSRWSPQRLWVFSHDYRWFVDSLLRFLGGLLIFPQQSFAGLLVVCRWSSGSSWSRGCIDGFDIPAESCRRHALSMFVQAISELHCILCSPLNEELHIKLDNNSGPDIGCQLHRHHGDIGHLNRNH